MGVLKEKLLVNDDFLILDTQGRTLRGYTVYISEFLMNNLKLELHPKKIILRKLSWGIDFLGYVILPHYILPRAKTKKRIFKKLSEKINKPNFNQSLQSYLGYLKHANTFKVIAELRNYKLFTDFNRMIF